MYLKGRFSRPLLQTLQCTECCVKSPRCSITDILVFELFALYVVPVFCCCWTRLLCYIHNSNITCCYCNELTHFWLCCHRPSIYLPIAIIGQVKYLLLCLEYLAVSNYFFTRYSRMGRFVCFRPWGVLFNSFFHVLLRIFDHARGAEAFVYYF